VLWPYRLLRPGVIKTCLDSIRRKKGKKPRMPVNAALSPLDVYLLLSFFPIRKDSRSFLGSFVKYLCRPAWGSWPSSSRESV